MIWRMLRHTFSSSTSSARWICSTPPHSTSAALPASAMVMLMTHADAATWSRWCGDSSTSLRSGSSTPALTASSLPSYGTHSIWSTAAACPTTCSSLSGAAMSLAHVLIAPASERRRSARPWLRPARQMRTSSSATDASAAPASSDFASCFGSRSPAHIVACTLADRVAASTRAPYAAIRTSSPPASSRIPKSFSVAPASFMRSQPFVPHTPATSSSAAAARSRHSTSSCPRFSASASTKPASKHCTALSPVDTSSVHISSAFCRSGRCSSRKTRTIFGKAILSKPRVSVILPITFGLSCVPKDVMW
mmetsp:Transcript_1597/g.5841  ORF Transcript_1597/g.5841 Transcript_1597/m.5841 type:complete len:307 (+) Transcript_1597:156-1076(+)